MSSSDAYQDEMGRLLRLSDEELSRLLAGEEPFSDEAFEEVASLLKDVRSSYAASSPDADVRARHIAAISELAHLTAKEGEPVSVSVPARGAEGPAPAQTPEPPTWRRVTDRMVSIALKGLAATMAASMSMVGLAYAGVDLPGQAAERAFEALTGLDLPNQGSETNHGSEGKSVSDAVRSVLEGDLQGCEKGQAVADAADANRADDGTTETDPCTQGDAEGSKATGEEKSADGRATADEKSEGRSESRGSDAAADGRATASEKSDGASDRGADNADVAEEAADAGSSKAGSGSDNADSGRETADDASGSGREKGSSAAEDGQSRNPTENGRP